MPIHYYITEGRGREKHPKTIPPEATIEFQLADEAVLCVRLDRSGTCVVVIKNCEHASYTSDDLCIQPLGVNHLVLK